jgi:flagellar biosynthesis/type III secretory pathway protein FliH
LILFVDTGYFIRQQPKSEGTFELREQQVEYYCNVRNDWNLIEKALSKQEGEYIMTLAEKLRQEGKAEGKIEGKQEGLRDAIELGMTLKFPGHMDEVMEQVANLSDLEALKKIKDAIKTVTDASQILLLINKAS